MKKDHVSHEFANREIFNRTKIERQTNKTCRVIDTVIQHVTYDVACFDLAMHVELRHARHSEETELLNLVKYLKEF